MNKKNIVNKLSHAFASIALKAGIASSNSACRFGYYQNTVRFLYKGIIINHNKNRASLH